VHRILVIGSGGREHALAWRLGRDRDVERVWVAPGNGGIARDAVCVGVAEGDAPAIVELCRRERVTLVVIGPEAPLAGGLADTLEAARVPVFGPIRAAAQLEASKWAAKEVMAAARVPTAESRVFAAAAEARAALDEFGPPWVVKADGLAAGKGVLVTGDRAEAERFIEDCLVAGRYGDAGRRVVLEEHLAGEEASVMAVCDGDRFVLLPAARDYKRAFDGDRGPNTGGMGAIAPSAAVTPALEETIARSIIAPTLEAMRRRGTPYRGALYAGLMLTTDGPRVIEFNARFGDPETQVVLPLVEGALADLLAGAAAGTLDPSSVGRVSGATVAVALVAEGYPDTGGTATITGLDRLAMRDDLHVFVAGASPGASETLRGGRLAHVVARAASHREARERVYAAIDTLGGNGWRARRDIGTARADSGATPAGGTTGERGAIMARGGSWR
jgi:phosphoribosylamine--glycine ligase